MEQGRRHYGITRATQRLKLVAFRQRPVERHSGWSIRWQTSRGGAAGRRVDRESKPDGERGIV